jgi:hypothetical protein
MSVLEKVCVLEMLHAIQNANVVFTGLANF